MDKLKKIRKAQMVTYTTEATAYLGGLVKEFREQSAKYEGLTSQLLSLEAQIALMEKMLCLTRDHLAMTIDQTDSARPNDWETMLSKVRFVGVRLADACMALLSEKHKMTPLQLLNGLNEGMFRFRTNSPMREIHAALLRQSFAKKVGESYVWIGVTQKQMPLRMRTLKTRIIEHPPVKQATNDSVKQEE